MQRIDMQGADILVIKRKQEPKPESVDYKKIIGLMVKAMGKTKPAPAKPVNIKVNVKMPKITMPKQTFPGPRFIKDVQKAMKVTVKTPAPKVVIKKQDAPKMDYDKLNYFMNKNIQNYVKSMGNRTSQVITEKSTPLG